MMELPDSVVFVEVDVQNDFCLPDGKLTVNPPEHVLRNMRLLSRHAPLLIGSVDTHFFDSWEFNTNDKKGPNGEEGVWPPHCIKGSDGWMRMFSKDRDRIQFIPADAAQVAFFEWTDTVFLEKEVYSLFANPFAKNVLTWAEAQAKTQTAVVYGVATDYCVKSAVLGLIDFGWDVIVADDAIRGVETKGHYDAMREMYEHGASFLPTSFLLHLYGKKA